MLQDPIYTDTLLIASGLTVSSAHDANQCTALVLTDVAQGKTVRKIHQTGYTANGFNQPCELSIASTTSKENVGMVTDRTAVRMQSVKTLTNGKQAMAQATLNFSFPREGWTPEEISELVLRLIGFLTVDPMGSTGQVTPALNFSTLNRIVAGER